MARTEAMLPWYVSCARYDTILAAQAYPCIIQRTRCKQRYLLPRMARVKLEHPFHESCLRCDTILGVKARPVSSSVSDASERAVTNATKFCSRHPLVTLPSRSIIHVALRTGCYRRDPESSHAISARLWTGGRFAVIEHWVNGALYMWAFDPLLRRA